MTFLPLLGGALILCLPKGTDNIVKIVAAVASFLPIPLAARLWVAFDRTVGGVNVANQFQFVEHYSWIPSINVEYFMGADGISLPMLLLTALVSFLAVIGSWGIKKQIKGYMALLLLLETGMMGVFASLDFFLFYVFWEVMLLPMYFLIGIWGGPRKEYAAIKFFLYTLFGSVLMLIVMLALYFNSVNPETGGHTFNMLHFMQQSAHNAWLKDFDVRILLFLGLFIGFAIKVPLFPFHTWLPDAHVEAPTAISVILAGILLKMGTYGLMRISFPIFPDVTVWFAVPMAILGVINIVYGALCAMAQSDLKKMVAYSSVSHMGFCLLGMAALTPAGMVGASFQMFSHGMITSMLFFLVGVVYDRAHHRDIDGFGGLGAVVPVYTFFVTVAFFASLGLPGFSGFVAEAMVFLGSFPVFRTIVIFAASGIIIVAAFHLWALQRVFLGPLNPKYAQLEEINAREIFCLAPLALLTLYFGVNPMPILNLMSTSLIKLVDVVKMVI
ncbi:MAG: NADH-quinone oxidoreductase subunit M [Deltaproteobacteria bacterium]|nr:NADH-quinone oxidoreductase subunit M [Deltaproteobacteria bacterium]